MLKLSQSRIRKLLPWLFLLGVYALLLVFYARYGMHYLNGDLATDMVMANHLNSEGVLLSEDFWYTTELRILNVVNVYQIGLLLFPDNWFAVRLFSIALLLPLMAASFIYMARGAGMKESAVWAAAVLMLPVSTYYLLLITYGLCYICYVIAAFLQFGLCFRLAKPDQPRSRQIFRWIFLFFWGILSGLQGLRLLMLSAAPLGITAFILVFLKLSQSRSLKETLHSREGRFFLSAVVNCLGILIGALVNMLVFEKKYHYAVQTDRILARSMIRDILAQIDAIFEELGWAGPVLAVNVQGVLSVLGLLLALFLIVSAVVLVVRKKQLQLDLPEWALFILAAVSLVLGIWLNAMFRCEGSYSPSYFMTGLMLLMASGFFLLEKLPVRMPWVKTLSILVLAGVFLLEGVGTLKRGVIQKTETPREQAAAWIEAHGYTQGYGTFWESNPITEATDGKVEMWTLAELSRPDRLYKWGQSMKHQDTWPEGPTFFYTVLTPEEYEMVVSWMGRDPDWMTVWNGHESDWTLPEGTYYHVIYAADSSEELFAPIIAANDYSGRVDDEQ